jgi:uncharacterized membrane protein YcaP (DUF421 family)
MELDLPSLFAIETPVAELVLRGTLIYWFLFLVFRFVLRRDVGGLSMADTLLLVIVADASQNALAGGYSTITEGVILLTTIIGWNYLLDWLAYHYRPFAIFAYPRTLLLVRHGQFIMRALRREMLSPEEVMSKLREQGITHLREVRHAYLESDGEISVARYHDAGRSRAPPPAVTAFRETPQSPSDRQG